MSTRRGVGWARMALAGFVLAASSVLPVGTLMPVAAATGWAEFGRPTATASFTTGVSFSQPVDTDREIGRVELLLGSDGAAGETVILVPPPARTGATTLTHTLDPIADGHIVPNTPLTARWRLVGADDPTDVEVGPEIRVTVTDDRFEWKTEAGELVRVHWYEGSDAFGARALDIGEDAVREATELLEVTESDPVDFFVYADQQAFYEALGPGTRENVGGQANAEIRTMFALISPSEINDSWVGIVIPHELTHLVFDTAASNPYHFPPRWLNEGLAVHISQGYDASDRRAVERSAAEGTLIPLDGLTGQFPTSFDRFSLAYAESVSAVDYLIRAHDEEALVSLIRSYADGLTDDEAFTAALGLDMSAFGAAWLDDLGAAPPTKYGPQPAPPGPVPSDWLGAPGSSALPAASGGAAASPGASPDSGTATTDSGDPVVVVLLVGLVLAGIVGVLVVRRRRASPGAAG
ncbi:MAG: peptidase MA family metallohydrolase [Chloroflexota bacterium]